ncbi:neurocalcin homolog isoform X2 [Babylonia areolata]
MGQSLCKHKLSTSQIRSLQRHVSFTEPEIEEWYHEFCRSANGPGPLTHDLHLNEDNFIKVYNSVYPGQCDEFARHVFRAFDLDGDRRVSFREFLIGLSLSGSEDMRKRRAWAFRVYDVEHTGAITLDSMTQIVKAVFQMIGSQAHRHAIADVSATSNLSLSYKGVTITPESLAEELFTEMDRDGNQRITWDEFCEGVVRNPTALQLLQCCPHGDDKDRDAVSDR